MLTDLVETYGSFIAVLTTGTNFIVDHATGAASSGWWVANADRVRATNYIAVCERYDPPKHRTRIHIGPIQQVIVDDDGRVQVHFQRERIIDVPELTWDGSNPVRYYPADLDQENS